MKESLLNLTLETQSVGSAVWQQSQAGSLLQKFIPHISGS